MFAEVVAEDDGDAVLVRGIVQMRAGVVGEVCRVRQFGSEREMIEYSVQSIGPVGSHVGAPTDADPAECTGTAGLVQQRVGSDQVHIGVACGQAAARFVPVQQTAELREVPAGTHWGAY